ncbi:MAG: serine protease [Candidatus Gracilibacteria bacterium]|nr:serine protease [Candidatus Gracilibacteria bacterium]
MVKLKKTLSFVLAISTIATQLNFVQAEDEKINISPIVQLVSYRNIYGKYVEMLGWGSASVINDKGVIISNNHVVDDGKGNVSEAFNVCVTKKEKEKPVCQYTASLIERNKDMDVSILKIDPVDIYGNSVDYSKFKTIDIDYSYEPKTQDEVIATGYPWIGSDTITETKGIVSGVSEYNNFNYIKTDTIIAGGNSGGALINKDGKLIGIPTFTYGGFTDSSLGYALSIKEAKSFIEENIDKSPKEKSSKIDFASYRSTIESLNKTSSIKDDFFDIKFNSNYEVKNYIKNKYLEIGPLKMKDNILNGVRLQLQKTLELKSEKELFYYLEKIQFYDKSYEDLAKKQIGGFTFYIPSYKQSLNEEYYTKYLAQISPNLVLVMEIQKGTQEDEEKAEKLKTELEDFLKGLNFNKNNLGNIIYDFKLGEPNIEIKSIKNSVENDINGNTRLYLGNLDESINFSIGQLDNRSGKTKTIDEIYKVETENVRADLKSKAYLNGYEGFTYCNNYPTSIQNYKGINIELDNCIFKFYGISSKDHYLEINLTAEKSKIPNYIDLVNAYLQKNVILAKKGDSKTELPNVYKNQIVLQFKDLENQSEAYKTKLKFLIKYNLLKNREYFEPYKSLTREEFVGIYVRYIFNYKIEENIGDCKDNVCKFKKYKVTVDGKEKTLYDILNKLGIPFKDYVNSEKAISFYSLFEMELAGVDTSSFTNETLYLYNNYPERKEFQNIKAKIDEFRNNIYGTRKITIDEVLPYNGEYSNFLSEKYISFYKGKGLKEDDVIIDKNKKMNFVNFSEVDLNDDYHKNSLTCLSLPNFSSFISCLKKLEIDNYSGSSFQTLTKAQAIDDFLNQMDFGLFDSELAKKKNTGLN